MSVYGEFQFQNAIYGNKMREALWFQGLTKISQVSLSGIPHIHIYDIQPY